MTYIHRAGKRKLRDTSPFTHMERGESHTAYIHAQMVKRDEVKYAYIKVE